MSLFETDYRHHHNRLDCHHPRSCSCSACERPRREWSALSDCPHPMEDGVLQNLDQVNKTSQSSEESIIIRDSCDIDVNTTSTQAAIGIQVAIQVAIAVIVEIAIADGDRREDVKQDLLQLIKIQQCNEQKTVIENSRGVRVTTTDNQVAVAAQIAVQVLVAILIAIDIL
ncbi:spore coat protein [Pueribacillus theae]|uniref:Spore coat protein n=1 Tax=Pueribacillus theae TaxID=2171751 RepID=A0A2U1K5T8_9BACI|nr:spore coat protein [Pueribacillus theae]PWA12742.1 spore coat protein [Pueribacillus theae]